MSGKKIAGPHVRDACARHLKDMVDGHERGFYFDAAAAERAIGFFRDVLVLNGGEFEGLPFELLDWQKFIVGSLFGWKGSDGWRRFRVAYIETAKGSGKSPLAAGVGMYGLVADNEPRAEIYAAATKKDQAMVLFRDAVAMWQQSPALKARLRSSGTGENVWNLAYLEKGSFFRPISADDGQSGPRPHMSLIDEVHEHAKNTVIEMQRAGTKSRRQALILMITNSGSNRTGPGWQYHDYSAKVCSGMLVDDSFFGYVCATDEGEDPFHDESCWPKVNPSLQGANLPGIKYLREQVVEARGMPGKEAVVRRLNFCQWTDAANPWISSDVWLGAQREFEWQELRGRRAWAGLDLSSTTDLTGLVLYVEPEQEGEPWHLVPFAWLPDDDLDRKEDKDRVPYMAWRSAGYLKTTQGRAISKLAVIKQLVEISSMFDLQAVAFDRWRMADLVAMASDNQIELPNMVPFGQGYKDMSPALEAFETALLNGQVVHPGNPVFTWCAANAVATQDDAENKKLSKEKATGRIDLMVAAVMAVGAASSNQGNATSFWETAE
jgi:phage terminase large subunit-like protein